MALTTVTTANNSITGAHIALGSDAAGDVMYYNGTDYVRLAVGTAGKTLKVNSGATAPEWGDAAAGASGGASDKIFCENGQTVTADYTITDTYNAGTFGPVSINSGVTVTIGDGEYWTIV